MGVRIQELPETTGINKEDVLIVEDGQGTKKGTVQQLDEALGVSQLKKDLGELITNNILAKFSSVSVDDTSYIYALKEFYSLEKEFILDETISVTVGSVENNKHNNYLAIDLYNSAGTKYNTIFGSGTLSYVVKSSDITNGLSKIVFIFYPTRGTALDEASTIYDIKIIEGVNIEYKCGDFLGLQFGKKVNSDSFIKISSKNLYNSDWTLGGINSSGVFIDENTTARITEHISLVKGHYTLSLYDIPSECRYFYVYLYNEDGSFIKYYGINNLIDGMSFGIDLPSDGSIMLSCTTYGSGTYQQKDNLLYPRKIQLERGYINTEYVNSNSHTVSNLERINLKDYYLQNNYIQSKVNRINDIFSSMSANSMKFIFITDEHWDYGNAGQSIPLIKYISENVNIDTLVNGGDTSDTLHGTFEFLNLLRKSFNGKILNVVGNHEYERSKTDGMINNIISTNDYIANGNPSRNYYYVDIPYKKIRLIVLNAFSYNQSYGYETEQVEWLTNALSMEIGWKSIIFTHNLYGISMSDNTIFLYDASEYIIPTLDANKDNIIAIFQGHNHKDRITHTPNGIPVIITTCDKCKIWNDSNGNPDINPNVDRTRGTIHENAFDVVGVDIDNKTITCIRIGGKAENGIDSNVGELVEERIVTW